MLSLPYQELKMSIAKARSLDLPELLDLITGLRMVTMGNDNAKSNLIARHNDTLPTIFTVLELVQHDDHHTRLLNILYELAVHMQ